MNRIDLENDIINMDGTTDLLKFVIYNSEEMDEDQLANALLGVEQLYRLRFNKLWDTFKQVYKLDEYRESLD